MKPFYLLLLAIALFAAFTFPLAAQEKKERTNVEKNEEKRDHGEHYGAHQPAPTDSTGTTHSVQLVWMAPVGTPIPPATTPPTQPSPLTYNVYKYGGQPGNPEPPNCAGTAVSSFFTISTGLTVLTFTDGPGIPNGVTRCYFVTAVGPSGVESDPSTILSVLVALPVPTKPTPPTGFSANVI
jgi:hypothetical protein